MIEVGRDQLRFTLDESTEVNSVNTHIIACFFALKSGRFSCWPSGSFFYCCIWKEPTV